jgi:photosystem II stability/assembly factor-like uncharacterized protein
MTDDELRDSFGDHITDALRVRAHGPAEPPPVQQELRLARSRRRTVAAAVVAFAVGAAAAVGVAVLVTRDDQARVRVGNETQPPAPTNPSGFTPLDTGIESWTWVNEEHGWVLLRRPCAEAVCPLLRETTDGGRTWRTLPTPDARVSGVRFATAKIGWLFGPTLFETRDGGHTWTRVPDVRIRQVEASAGLAMRVTERDSSCAYLSYGCPEGIDRRPLDADQWQRVDEPSFLAPSLIRQGADSYVVGIPNWAGGGETHIEHSDSGGKTWTAISDPCPSARFGTRGASVSAAPGGVLAVLCASVTDPGAPGAVRVSTDRGRAFGPTLALPQLSSAHLATLAAGSAGTIAVAYSDEQTSGVVVTNDGGETWHTTLRPSGAPTAASTYPPTLGWQDAKTARVSFNTDAIWTTRDGGRSWTRHLVSP